MLEIHVNWYCSIQNKKRFLKEAKQVGCVVHKHHFTQEVAMMPGWKGLMIQLPMTGTAGTTQEPAAGSGAPCRTALFKSLGATAAKGSECANGACKWTPLIMCTEFRFISDSIFPTEIWLGAVATTGLTSGAPTLFITAAPGCTKEDCILSCTSCME